MQGTKEDPLSSVAMEKEVRMYLVHDHRLEK
jgi:hypothetical protein